VFFTRSAVQCTGSLDVSNAAHSRKSTRAPRAQRHCRGHAIGRTSYHSRPIWRRAVTLALAVTTAVPLGGPMVLLFSGRANVVRAADVNAAVAAGLNAYADNASADMNSADVAAARAALDQMGEPVDDAGKLAKGIAQFNAQEYEESVATLQSVNGDELSPQGKQSLTDIMAKASAAADQRKNARAQFEKGEQALAANQPGVAMDDYKAVVANSYADDGTVAKAKEEEAVAQDGIKKASVEMKGLYAQAIDDYKSGKYDDAKAEFTTLQNAGFRAPLFQRSPGDYLNDINGKLAAMPSAAPAPSTPAPATPAPADAAAPTTTPSDNSAAAATPVPATAPADNTAAAAPTTAPAPAIAVAPEAPPPAPNPNSAYHLARQQYNKGDWISARQNFVIARDGGYKAGLFEDSPDKYLARMDAKEQADDRRHQEEIRQQEMLAAAAAAAAASASAAAASAQATTAPTTQEAAATQPTPDNTVATTAAAVTASSQSAGATATTSPAIADTGVMPAATAPTTSEAANVETPTTAPSGSEATAPTAVAVAGAAVVATPTAEQELSQTADAQRIKQQQLAFEAKQKVADAQDARAQNRLDDALDLYSQAVMLDPTNQDAINGKNDLLTITGRQPGQSRAMDNAQKEIEARRQSIQYSFETAIEEAQTDIDGKKIADAKVAIERAKVARNTDPQIFRDDEIRAFDTRIAGAETALAAASSELSQEQLDQQQAETAKRLAMEQSAREEQKRRTVAALIGNARSLTEQGKYREALSVIDQILVIDPGNDYAVGVRPLVRDRADFAEQRKYREDYDQNFTTIFNQAEEKRIPYNDILRYPENWPDLTETRERSVAAERGEQVADQAVAAQLDRRLPEIKFDAVGFSDVVDFLRDLTSANIFVNWRALEAAGVDKNAPVTARLRDVPFSKVLRTILDDVSGGTTKLGYTIDEGVITISTEDDLAKNTSTRVYDIRDLIIDVPDFTDAPTVDLTTSGNSGTTVGGGGGGGGGGSTGGQSLFGGGGGGGGGATAGPTRQELVEAITKLIEDTVASDTWKDNGGTTGSIRELGGQLIVTQTPENQRELVKLLDQLREQRALQVTIEARFLFVNRNFLDSLGVDFNFSFGNGTGGVAGNIPNPITVTQNSSSFTSPASLGTSVPGSIGSTVTTPNLSTSITFLSDFQANLVVQATQDTQNSSNLTAPRVTLFNGQRAYVAVTTQFAYVSDLTPVVGTGAIGFAPTITNQSVGVVLDVTATISADRKYVTLTLRPTLSTLEALLSFPVALAVAGATGVGSAGSAATTESNIQEPEIEVTKIRTTVSVPDGGTLLIGGQTLSAEVDRESGVPILSKIPFLSRLFTNRAMAKDDQVLLILVKPTIIIQREREEEQFPLLNTAQQ
jgi:type II secretory pathway component GspD/PulD (secretin)/TolA-binding protein